MKGTEPMEPTHPPAPSDFIRDIIEEDLKTNKYQGVWPPGFPPNRMDTPISDMPSPSASILALPPSMEAPVICAWMIRIPSGEDQEYVDSIIRDVKWLGFDWEDRLYYASDYYEQLYQYALQLIREGKAFVCNLSADEIREYRGTLTKPGKESPYRNRSVEENLDLFERMRAGEFEEGAHVLRAKIDMASPNITMRDPVIYRIKKSASLPDRQ